MANEGEPISETDKAAQERVQKALEEVEKEQVEEKQGSQIKEVSGDLFPPEKPPSR